MSERAANHADPSVDANLGKTGCIWKGRPEERGILTRVQPNGGEKGFPDLSVEMLPILLVP
jgi:hypothetical protein